MPSNTTPIALQCFFSAEFGCETWNQIRRKVCCKVRWRFSRKQFHNYTNKSTIHSTNSFANNCVSWPIIQCQKVPIFNTCCKLAPWRSKSANWLAGVVGWCIAKMIGVEPYVLRYWETEFPEIAPVKSKARQRLYKRNDVELIYRIRDLLYQQNFTIKGAKKKIKDEKSHGKSSESQIKFSGSQTK